MLMIVAFVLFAILVAAWVTAPASSPERRPVDAATQPAMPDLRTHVA